MVQERAQQQQDGQQQQRSTTLTPQQQKQQHQPHVQQRQQQMWQQEQEQRLRQQQQQQQQQQQVQQQQQQLQQQPQQQQQQQHAQYHHQVQQSLCRATSQMQCNTAYYAPLSPGYPNPLFGTYMLYFLKYCLPQVKTCFGCDQTLKPGGQIGKLPYDLVNVSNAKRFYYDRAGQLKERPGNVYYHVNAGCMKKHQAYFMASQMQKPYVIKDMMTPAQYQCQNLG